MTILLDHPDFEMISQNAPFGCRAGYTDALYHLGNTCAYGVGVPQDDKKAISCCQRAAGNGDDLAKLFLQALKGDAKSQYKLSQRYTHDGGFMQDNKKAMLWLEKAVAQGYPEAKATLEKMGRASAC